jgi:hypothetical protein
VASRHVPSYRRNSEAQANAEALARRSVPYAAEHRRSLVETSTPSITSRARGASLRTLERGVTRDFALEAPGKTTDGLHHLDAGGVPEFSAEFHAYLQSSPTGTDTGDPEDASKDPDSPVQGYFRWPSRAALWYMVNSGSQRVARLGMIVERVVRGESATDAAIAFGAHPDDARDTARRALETFVSRRASLKLRLPKREDDG